MKKTLNKIATIALIACIAGTSLSGCTLEHRKVPKIKIVTTIFPYYNWVQNLIKGNEERFDLIFLAEGAEDIHAYTPAPKDITNTSTCSLFIYTGGHTDAWVDKVSISSKTIVVKTLDVVNKEYQNASNNDWIVETSEIEPENQQGDVS